MNFLPMEPRLPSFYEQYYEQMQTWPLKRVPIAVSNQSPFSRSKGGPCRRCQLVIWKQSLKCKVRVAVPIGEWTGVVAQVSGLLAEPLICMWWESPLERFWNHWHLQNKSFCTNSRSLKCVLKYKGKTASAATRAWETHFRERTGRFMPQVFCKRVLEW